MKGNDTEYISVRGTSQFKQMIGKRDLAAPIFASALREFIKRPRPRRCVSNLLRCDCARCGERRFWWPWHCLRMEPQHSKPRLRTGRSRHFLTPMVTGVKGVKPIQKTWHVKSLEWYNGRDEQNTARAMYVNCTQERVDLSVPISSADFSNYHI